MLEPSKNRAKGEKQRRRSGTEKSLIAGITVVSVIAVVFLILYFTKRCSPSEEECTDKNCVKAAADLLDFVDLKKDPCNDFYNYVCGHYIRDAVKNDEPTPILTISKQFTNELKAIIVDPILKKDSKSNIAMKQFYQACMNETKIDQDKDSNFWKAINELGGWPSVNGTEWEGASFDWVDWHINSVKLGVPAIGFFDFRPAKASDNTTTLRVTSSALSDVKSSSFSRSLLNEIAKSYKEDSSGVSSENGEVHDFLRKVKELAGDLDENEDADEDISTVEDLHRECPQVPWLKILNRLSDNVRKITNESTVIYGAIGKYCGKLETLLKDTPNRIIADYYVWSIMHKSRNFMSRKVRNAYEDIEEKNTDRYQTCLDFTDERFQYLKETVYIRRKTNPHVKEQLEEMVEIMKEVFIEHIKASTWMDEETKKRGVDKAQLIEKIVGADDILYDVEKFDKLLGIDGIEFSSDNPYQILREKRIRENRYIWETIYEETPDDWEIFFDQVVTVNAFFAGPLNVMIIPAPILNSVFFNHKSPAFMNYGSIGRVIGHEIQHGFGESGRTVVLKNNEEVDWWTNATAEAFNSTKQCAIKEYEQVPFYYKLDGTLTLEENLADLVGIDVAYEAYERWVKKHGEEKRLPGIPLTPKQIFWIQTGTFLCFRKLEDGGLDLNQKDEHAIPLFRVTAGARNSKYFANDFNCPVGSFMNPKEKCRIL